MPDNFLESVDLVTEGYEDPMGENGSSENFGFFNSEEVQSPEGKTVTGKAMSSHLVTAISNSSFKEAFFGTGDHILGMPFRYTNLADPLSRVYQDTFESDNTCIAFIKFGTARINRLLYQKMTIDSGGTSSSLKNLGTNILLGLRSAVSPTESSQDQRLISFDDSKMDVFMKYASASLNQLWILLDLPGQFDPTTFSDFSGELGKGFAFYCVKTGSFNEGLANTYTVPAVVEKMNGDAAEKRTNYQLYGTYGGVATAGENGTSSAGAWLSNILSGAAEKIKEDIANAPIIGSVASAFMSSNKGSMSYYAKIWQDSQPERSYSMSFKFRTAYGNKWDIYRNVFFPFILLHTAAMPKQDGRFSYQEPFLVKIDFPGWFRVNCGVITNLSWVKGGDTQSWSVDGLPLEITVTMAVDDLYPIELASENTTVMEYNWGLLSFLENMAGLTFADVVALNPYKSKYLNMKNAMALQDGSIGSKLKQYGVGWKKTAESFGKNFIDKDTGDVSLLTGAGNIIKQTWDSYSYIGTRRH